MARRQSPLDSDVICDSSFSRRGGAGRTAAYLSYELSTRSDELSANWQNRMKCAVSLWILTVFAAVPMFVGCKPAYDTHAHDDWQYNGEFHKVIEQADRLVVRDGGYNCCGPVDNQAILLTITNPREIGELHRIIEFETHQPWSACMCCGYPGLDWYRGKKRVALTALHHGRAIRWSEFPGDAQLTPRSSQAIVDWLAERGITGPLEEVEVEKHRAAIAKEARTLLAEHVSTEVLAAVSAAQAEAEANIPLDDTAAFDVQARLMDTRIREAFGDVETMYSTLFQILGCVPMHWNSRLAGEQDTSYEFLVRAPREELNSAIRAALQSKLASERQGAARLVFSQLFMTNYGKTERDIEGWMELLAGAAYDDSFAENRRLVLYRLVEHPSVRARQVLQKAIADPDQTVRRYAIEALSQRDSQEIREILARVAKGQLQSRESQNPPRNYGDGTGTVFYIPGMDPEVFADTDQEAAGKALRAVRK